MIEEREVAIDPKLATHGNQFILFDAAAMSEPGLEFFDPIYWQKLGALEGSALGRGTTHLFNYEDENYVLRHYRRGGLASKLSSDSYLWSGLEQTRAWLEWQLLAEMYWQGLPVPRPVAARVIRLGIFYRADIITKRLAGVKTLADRLSAAALAEEAWVDVGRTVRRFHEGGIYHADLNARNILLDALDKVYLLDFDRGERRTPSSWQQANLQRLQRSLEKFANNFQGFHYSPQCMQWLMAGYGELSPK